jgi:hypothetical protein
LERLLVFRVGGAEVAPAEFEVAEQRRDGRAVERDAVGAVSASRIASRRSCRRAAPDVGQRDAEQAGVAVEELLGVADASS